MGKKIALFVVVLLVVVAVGVNLFLRVDQSLAQFSPEAIELEEAIGFVGLAISIIIGGATLGFALFRFLLWRLVTLKDADDIRKLRWPWLWSLIGIFVVAFVVTLVLGLTVAKLGALDKVEQVPVIGWALYTALAFGAAATILYWLFTLISVPDRNKYSPVGRYQLVRLLSRTGRRRVRA